MVEWLSADSYDKVEGVYSATQLLKPTRMIVLEKQHEAELEMDISERAATKLGDVVRVSFEKVELSNCIQERRFIGEIVGQKIQGRIPILQLVRNSYVIWDIIQTTTGNYLRNLKEDANIMKMSIWRLIVDSQDDIEKKVRMEAKIIYAFENWYKAKPIKDYPQLKVHVENIKLMSSDETREFISDKLKDINQHIDTPEPDLPLCTPDELWQKDDKWAVMREGRKIAVRVWDSENDCHRQMKDLRKGHHYIEFRPGKVNRCGYCLVRKWCSQFKELEAEGRIAD